MNLVPIMMDSCPEDAPPPKVKRRVVYAATTLESIAWLLASCQDIKLSYIILKRAMVMLNNAWTAEYNAIRQLPVAAVPMAIQQYWDAVAIAINHEKVHTFRAFYGPQVNPPGDIGNVDIRFQASTNEEYFEIKVRLNDQLSRDDYELINKKAGV